MNDRIIKLLISLIPIKNLRHNLRQDFFPEKIIQDKLLLIKKSKVIEVCKENKKIIIPKDLEVYIYDLNNDFDLYFDAVEPKKIGKYYVVDYTRNKIHKIKKFNLHKIMLPSFTESLNPILQYAELMKLQNDSIVIDLGAYCGLASILFDIEICKNSNKNECSGKVIAVDADPKNEKSIKYNFKQYLEKTKRKIEYIKAAAWSENTTLKFASQGYMGASVFHVGKRGDEISIPAINLTSISEKYSLNKVDFVKCDIEGAEIEVIKDEKFFRKFMPKIVMECHYTDLEQTHNNKEEVIKTLEYYGYECKEINQDGFNLPLIYAEERCLQHDT